MSQVPNSLLFAVIDKHCLNLISRVLRFLGDWQSGNLIFRTFFPPMKGCYSILKSIHQHALVFRKDRKSVGEDLRRRHCYQRFQRFSGTEVVSLVCLTFVNSGLCPENLPSPGPAVRRRAGSLFSYGL